MSRHQGIRARELFSALRSEIPEIVQAEKDLGSRLTVAKNVIRLRVQRGYTQQRLAGEMGVKQPRIAEIESARANCQIDTLDRLARVFGVETASLFRVDKGSSRRAAIVPEPTK